MENVELKALVTGGTGFIGSNLIKQLLKMGWIVYVLIRNKSSIGAKRLKNVENINWMYYGELFNYKRQIKVLNNDITINKNLIPKFDVCFHLAAYGVNYNNQDVNELITGNIKFTMDLLNFCKKNETRRVINTGSCFEYGVNDGEKIIEKHNINPQSLYGAAKACSVFMANTYSKKYGINLITLRPFGVFGEGEGLHRLVPQIMESIILKQDMKLTYGEQVRDYLYVRDLINAYITLALEDVPLYEVYNVCSGVGTSIRQLVMKAASITNSNLDLFHFGEIPYRKNEIMYFVGDNSKLKKCTSWKPKYTLEEGLKRTYEWYKVNLGETT